MDRRALPGLFGGLAGCAFGIVGAVVGSPFAVVLGAACSLTAAASSLALVATARRAERLLAHVEARSAGGDTLGDADAGAVLPPPTLVDPETGLPDGRFFDVAVAARIAAARRHLWPVTIVLLDVTPHEGQSLRHAVSGFCALVRQTLREADAVCRTGPSTFAVLLEDTNEAGGVWAAERVQAALARDEIGVAQLVAGVATYPTHGLDATIVHQRAKSALARAAAADAGHGLGAVEVAVADPAA